MNPFSEDQLVRLEAQFPLRDVRRLAAAVAVKPDVRLPMAMLISWLTRADRLDSDRVQPDARPATAPDPPLSFGTRSDPGYAAFRGALIGLVLEGLSRFETADVLARHHVKFAHLDGGRLGEELDAEIASLRRSGPTWDESITPPPLTLLDVTLATKYPDFEPQPEVAW